MCDNSLFTSGIVRPDEVSRLQAIYDETARQYWFDRDSEAKRAFATHLIAIYRVASLMSPSYGVSLSFTLPRILATVRLSKGKTPSNSPTNRRADIEGRCKVRHPASDGAGRAWPQGT